MLEKRHFHLFTVGFLTTGTEVLYRTDELNIKHQDLMKVKSSAAEKLGTTIDRCQINCHMYLGYMTEEEFQPKVEEVKPDGQ